MASDRAGARQRVRAITAWAAAGAAALTGGVAFGATRSGHRATHASVPIVAPATEPPQQSGTDGETQVPDQGFTPPTTSQAPPAATSGGS